MITFQQALSATEFHENHEPAGKIFTWRRNGATRTWKTRPGQFRIPVKYGLRSYDQIRDTDAGRFHVAEDCPTRHVKVQELTGEGSEPAQLGAVFYGIVVSPEFDGQSQVTVQVTTRGTSKHRVGSRVDVGTASLTDL